MRMYPNVNVSATYLDAQSYAINNEQHTIVRKSFSINDVVASRQTYLIVDAPRETCQERASEDRRQLDDPVQLALLEWIRREDETPFKRAIRNL